MNQSVPDNLCLTILKYQQMETTRITVQSTIQAVITFSGENGATLVTLTFDAEKVNTVEMQKEGWQAILNNFKQYVEL